MEKIDGLLGGIKGMTRFFSERRAEKRIRSVWADVAGQLADQLAIGYFREGVLYLSSTNPIWRAEVEFISGHLLKKLGKSVGSAIVKKIQVVDDLVECKKVEKGPSNEGLSLEQLVKFENEKRRKDGMSLCLRCEAVYSYESECLFCRVR